MKTILTVLLLSLLACSSPRTVSISEDDFLKIVYATNDDGSPAVGEAHVIYHFLNMLFGSAQIIPFEENYALLDFEWIVFNYLPYYRELLNQRKIKYSPQFDCEDYANMFKLEMQNLYRKQPMAHQGLAVATIIYNTGNGYQSHAINAIFSVVDGKFLCMLIEPQNGSIVRFDTFNPSQVWLVLL